MTPEQIQQLLASLSKIAEGLTTNRPYTLTGASDWPILVFCLGIIIAMLAFMWRGFGKSLDALSVEIKELGIGGLKDRVQKQETKCESQMAHCPVNDRRHPVHGRRAEDAEDGSGV